MKIALILPRNSTENSRSFYDYKFYSSFLFSKKYISYLLAIPTLASLTPPHHEIRVFDENIQKIDYSWKADLVGISVRTMFAERAYTISQKYRDLGVKTVLGGIHPSMCPDEALNHCDSVVVGEAEDVWAGLLKDAEEGHLKKRYQYGSYSDLSRSPAIYRKSLSRNMYFQDIIQTTKGCPFHCEFCSVYVFDGQKNRHKSVDQVIQEIFDVNSTRSKYKSKKAVFIADDNIIANRKFARELFTAMKPHNINWMCQSSIDISKEDELLALMRDGGCGAIFIGFESVSVDNLKAMHKDVNQRFDYVEAIRKIQSYGMLVHSSFIVGYDYDSEKTYSELIHFIEKTNLLMPLINILTPFPGTELFRRLEKEGRILHKDWSKYNTQNVVFSHLHQTSEELTAGYRRIIREVYSFDSVWRKLNYYWDIDFWKRSNELDPVKFIYRALFTLRLGTMLFSRNIERSRFIMKLLPRIFNKRVRISAILSLMAYNDFALHLEDTPDDATDMMRPADAPINNFSAADIGAANLVQLLENAVQKHAERTVIINEKQNVTYGQLNRAVNAVARLIKQSDVGKGDKVALMLPNIPEFVYSYFGALKTGAVVVPLNTSSTPFELTYLLNNSDSKLLITQASYMKKHQDAQNQLLSCHKVILIDSANKNGELISDTNSKDLTEFSENINPDDPAVIIYTAGLTGRPLGAVLTHRNLCSQADVLQSIVRRTPDDVALSLIPLFHAFGATVNMLLVIRSGCSMVMMDRLSREGLFRAIEKEKITYIAAVPLLYMGMIFYEKSSKYDLSSLKLCITGGAPMPAEFLPVFEQKFGIRLFEGYGLTEASPVCSFNRPGIIPVPGSIGTSMPGVDIKIVDEKGHELPRNEIGELIVKGDNVMKGYYKNEAATAAVIKDGWLYTRDLGRMDDGNYIFLTGLKKRMIITSGFNVYPREVETVLNMHPAVKASRVWGKEDLMRGEIVKAYIILQGGHCADEKEIIRYCKTYLSNYKVPREVEFVQGKFSGQ